MRIIRAEGPAAVAKVLRELADQIQADAPIIHAVVSLPDEVQSGEEVLELRLRHPATHRWNLVELNAALSHPGD
jgi:hypothetical protein